MNKILFSIIILCFSARLFAQGDETLLTIGDKKISKSEFEYIYQKNNNNLYSNNEKKSPQEYLDLFINFKLKVIEAESLQMDTAKDFVKELSKYRKDLAAPYLTDVQYNEQQIKDIYYRLKHEVKASHILLKYNKKEGSAKEKEVLNKIKAIRQEIINGKPFAKAAVEYSEDPSASKNKGNLGYFSAFIMVTPFEDAAFNTPVGEISEPVKTDYGYHLIKVDDIRENKGEIHVAHIMKSFPHQATAKDKEDAKTAIDSIYQLLLNGADFAEMAKKESQDRRSAINGGVLQWFTAGRIVKEFSDAAFALQNDGDISEPIATPYGYHIIKRLKTRPIPSYEEAKSHIESRIKKDAIRRESKKKAFADKLKKEYNFSENNEAKQQLEGKNVNDTTITPATLFTIDNREYKTTDLKNYITKNRIRYGNYLSVYDKWVEDEVIDLEDSKLEGKYPQFRFLMNEYHDGILLFNISQEKIWKYAEQDSVGLEKFFEKDKKKHIWGERFKGSIFTCKNKDIREKAEKLYETGLTVSEIADTINTEKEELISVKTGAWEESKNPIVDYYVWNGKTPENFNGETTFVKGNKIQSEPKTLEDARGLYISDYQDYLDTKWIKQLHSKYKIKINKKLLKTIENE